MSIGKNFIAAITAAQSLSDFFTFGPIDHLFKGSEVEVWSFVSEFIKKYGELPKAGTIQTHTGVALATTAEPAAYYLDLMRVRHQELCIKFAMKKAQDQLQPGGEGSEAALTQITQMVLNLLTQGQAHQVADLRSAYKLLIQHYAAHNHGDLQGLKLGWPYFDEMSGGIRKSDLVSMVGRPGIGKTWQMLYSAYTGWAEAEADPQNLVGEPRMFVSMEMDILSIQQRLASLHTKVKMTAVKKSSMSTVELKTYKKGLKVLEGFKAPFWVIDGSMTATVDDVYLLAKQLKPKAVFIDGAYLMKHPTERDRYKRVSENADLLHNRIAAEIGPVVASWQFARTASKKKKGEEVTLDDIAYADAIGQASSIVMGIFEEETVETLKQRRVKILKGRNGETGEFLANWNFDKMDFSQVLAQAVEDLSFV